MSRRKAATKREILPDSKYNNLVIAKFINNVMWDGKKEIAENITYEAIDMLAKIAQDGDGVKLFLDALEALKPSVEVKGRRVGGATYQVPVEVRADRQQTLAIRWAIQYARKRGERRMADRVFGGFAGHASCVRRAGKPDRERPGAGGRQRRGAFPVYPRGNCPRCARGSDV